MSVWPRLNLLPAAPSHDRVEGVERVDAESGDQRGEDRERRGERQQQAEQRGPAAADAWRTHRRDAARRLVRSGLHQLRRGHYAASGALPAIAIASTSIETSRTGAW